MKKIIGKKDRVTIFPITERGYALATGLASIAGEVRVFRPVELRGGKLRGLVKEAFLSSRAVVFVGASGIAVRAIAPLLKGKEVDPAVLVMDEKARFVISLLSGHLGGANQLAEEIAAILNATAVVTTATDVNNLPCIEDVALEFNLAIENVRGIKAVNSAILAGGPIHIADKNQKRLKAIRGFLGKDAGKIFTFGRLPRHGARAVAIISSALNISSPKGFKVPTLRLRPKEFVAGLGCRRGTGAEDIKKAVDRAFKARGISPLCIRNLATIDIKADEAGLLEFAASRGLELELFTAKELNTRATRSSSFVLTTTGAGGVSEPAALLSAGAKRLWLKKQKSARVTVAAARLCFTS
ncbi:MAG: cobalt-precorrin 5A hydrolase [Thermodesulfobacteriota bacterium]